MTLGCVDAAGWLGAVRCEPSPNCDARPPGALPSLLVLHAISLPPGHFGSDDILDLFANRLDPGRHPYFEAIHSLRVSAHFLIRRNGELIQFVSCDDRAWHAGVSSWCGRERCNDFSIGIELEGCDELPFEPVQYERLLALIEVLRQRYPMICDVAGHCDVAPGRKTDPGPFFDWQQLSSLPVRLR